MNEDEIKLVASNDLLNVASVLNQFLKNNEIVFTFPNLSQNSNRVTLWSALFEHLQRKTSVSVHVLCLATIRLLSRDKTELENLICEKWIIVLIERAGLYSFLDPDESSSGIKLPEKDIVVEAMKCLCNIAFNSETARALCAHTEIARGLVARLRSYKEISFKEDIMLFDMKLLFILTALRQDIKSKIKNELHGLDYLISCLNELVVEASLAEIGATASSGAGEDGNQYCLLSENQQAIACEILKTQFNLILQSGPEEHVDEAEEAMYLKLMPALTSLLYAHTSSEEKLMELHSNVANLLTSVPPIFYQYLTPKLEDGERSQFEYNGRNMDALQSLLHLLQYRLSITTGTKNQYENLSPILTVLNKSARGCREQRKYLRGAVLPPLRDVSRPPEQGSTLRNQLCRLLTTPVTSVRDLVAEFLFILCKEKVGRMVKYTGFGNAAGHLAQKGLLGGARGAPYSSSSDDSDTDEYREAEPRIDPVVGCTRPPRANPFEGMTEEQTQKGLLGDSSFDARTRSDDSDTDEYREAKSRIDPFKGMTEEQKEYEAMKLVNLFDKMVSAGAVRPARVGEDGRPQPLDHVLQLRDQPPRPHS